MSGVMTAWVSEQKNVFVIFFLVTVFYFFQQKLQDNLLQVLDTSIMFKTNRSKASKDLIYRG